MNFKELQDAVLADAFAEAKRDSAKEWINHRYTWLCDLEEWTFMESTATVLFTAGSQVCDELPTDFVAAKNLWDANGRPLRPIRDSGEFFSKYNQNLHQSNSSPEAFTVVGGNLLVVGPQGDGSSGLLVYQRAAQLLVNDTDVPIIPEGYHVGLVQGAKAEGFKLTNIVFFADSFDEDFRGTIDAMRSKYLAGVRDKQHQSPAYRPWG